MWKRDFGGFCSCAVLRSLDVVRAIRGTNLIRCKIYTGPIDGSALLYSCHDCVFNFAARQVRVVTAARVQTRDAAPLQPLITVVMHVLVLCAAAAHPRLRSL